MAKKQKKNQVSAKISSKKALKYTLVFAAGGLVAIVDTLPKDWAASIVYGGVLSGAFNYFKHSIYPYLLGKLRVK